MHWYLGWELTNILIDLYTRHLTDYRLIVDQMLIECWPSINQDIDQVLIKISIESIDREYINQHSTADDPLVHMIQIILGNQLKHVWGTGIYTSCNQACFSVPCTIWNCGRILKSIGESMASDIYIFFYIILLLVWEVNSLGYDKQWRSGFMARILSSANQNKQTKLQLIIWLQLF